jgi:hypothetical protein
LLLVGCTKAPTVESPSKITRDELHFFSNRTQIDLTNYTWIYFNKSETDSMYPAIKKNSHAIGLEVDEETQISVGDIIYFEVPGVADAYAHRVVEEGSDELGEYFITKGDNNRQRDNIRIRRDQISYIIAAIIY